MIWRLCLRLPAARTSWQRRTHFACKCHLYELASN